MCPRYTIWTAICQSGSSTVSGCAIDTPSGEISDARTVTASPDAVSSCNGPLCALSKRDMISGIELRAPEGGHFKLFLAFIERATQCHYNIVAVSGIVRRQAQMLLRLACVRRPQDIVTSHSELAIRRTGNVLSQCLFAT